MTRRVSTRALVLTATAIVACVAGALVGALVRDDGRGGDPTHGEIVRLPGPEPAAENGGVPPVGPSGWFTVLWAIDETVGLPAPDTAREYPDHTAVARKLLQRLARGDVEAARRLMDPQLRSRLSEDGLRRRWERAVDRVGPAPHIADDQRWSTLRIRGADTAHTDPGARCRVTYVIEHRRGRVRHELELVRGELGPAIVDYALAELPAR